MPRQSSPAATVEDLYRFDDPECLRRISDRIVVTAGVRFFIEACNGEWLLQELEQILPSLDAVWADTLFVELQQSGADTATITVFDSDLLTQNPGIIYFNSVEGHELPGYILQIYLERQPDNTLVMYLLSEYERKLA